MSLFPFESSLCAGHCMLPIISFKLSCWRELGAAPSVKWKRQSPPPRVLGMKRDCLWALSRQGLAQSYMLSKCLMMLIMSSAAESTLFWSQEPWCCWTLRHLPKTWNLVKSESSFLLTSNPTFCHSLKTRGVGPLEKHGRKGVNHRPRDHAPLFVVGTPSIWFFALFSWRELTSSSCATRAYRP